MGFQRKKRRRQEIRVRNERADGQEGRESIVEQRILCSEHGRRGWLTNERKRKNVYSGLQAVAAWATGRRRRYGKQRNNERTAVAMPRLARSRRVPSVSAVSFSIPRSLCLDWTGSEALTPHSTIRSVTSERQFSTRTSL